MELQYLDSERIYVPARRTAAATAAVASEQGRGRRRRRNRPWLWRNCRRLACAATPFRVSPAPGSMSESRGAGGGGRRSDEERAAAAAWRRR